MLWALEGADGTGKTTLARKLLASASIRDASEIRHRGRPDGRHALDEYVSDLADYLPRKGHDLVLDRWHLGELVYGPLYRGGSRLDAGQRLYVDLVLDRLGAVKVLTDADAWTVRDRLKARGEDFLRDEHVERVLHSYRALVVGGSSGWRVVTDADPQTVDLLRDSADEREASASALTGIRTYVGPTRTPWAVLFGDERNPRRRDELPHQFAFPPYESGSGRFLLNALVDATPAPYVFGVANANDLDDPVDLLQRLRNPPAIALGRRASEALRDRGVPHHSVPHPQYVKRFHNGLRSRYGQAIVRVGNHDPRAAEWHVREL